MYQNNANSLSKKIIYWENLKQLWEKSQIPRASVDARLLSAQAQSVFLCCSWCICFYYCKHIRNFTHIPCCLLFISINMVLFLIWEQMLLYYWELEWAWCAAHFDCVALVVYSALCHRRTDRFRKLDGALVRRYAFVIICDRKIRLKEYLTNHKSIVVLCCVVEMNRLFFR